MNRFLKKEWEDTEIPERAYLQARNRAWSRLHPVAKPAHPQWIWATAAGALVAGLALFWFSGRENSSLAPNPAQVEATQQESAAPTKAAPAIVADGRDVRATVLRQKSGPKRSIGKSRKPALQAVPAEDPDRLVLNFVLPESGVRMIWILDKDFQLNGEIE